ASVAWNSVTLAAFAAQSPHSPAALPSPDRIAMAYRSDRFFRFDGETPNAWSPYSRFWRTADGWIRTHGNYPHHARAFRSALRLEENTAPAKADALLGAMLSQEAVDRIVSAGGLAVRVKPEDRETDAALRSTPLVDVRNIGTAPSHDDDALSDPASPLRGI